MGTGRKDDGVEGGKIKDRWDLLPIECIQDVVKILTFGSIKYGAENWKSLENGEDRYYAALMRHMAANRMGETIDQESGLSHLSHAMCNIVFLLWLEKHKVNGEDKRLN